MISQFLEGLLMFEYVGDTTGFSIKKRKGPYKKPHIIPKVYGLSKYGPLDF